MKNFILPFFVCFIALVSRAQQTPFHKQYYVNPFVINPAMAGDQERMNLYLMHRSQWTSLPDAPVTSTLTFDSPIVYGINGVGISMFTDQAGIFRRTGGTAAYAHSLQFGSNVNLRLGLGVNVFDNKVDFSKVQVVQGGDPYVFNNAQNKPVLDGTGGLNLRIQRFNFGASIAHFGFNKLSFENKDNTANYRQELFLQGTMNYKFLFGSRGNLAAIPMVSFRYFDKSPYQFDLNGILEYKEKVWVAGTYRSDYGISVAAGFRLYNTVTVGYSYDIITNRLKGLSGMSSEVIVGIKFGKTAEQKSVEFIDSDKDGVADEFDLEPDTEEGAFVNFQGITIKNRVLLESRDTLIIREIIYIDSTNRRTVTQTLTPTREIKSIFFDYDRSNLKRGQEEKLVAIAKALKEDTSATIVITGHADSRGTDEYNYILGQRRGNTIAEELVKEYGIDPSRIQVETKGKSEPLAKGRSSINRRADIEIIPSGGSKNSLKSTVGSLDDPNNPVNKMLEGEGIAEREVQKEEKPKKEVQKEIEKSNEENTYNPNGGKVDDGLKFEDKLSDGIEKDELFFSVQMGVFFNPVKEAYWQRVDPLYKLKLDDGTTRFFTGVYPTEAEANKRLEEIKAMGFSDAFTTAYFNGQRITLPEANEILKAIGKDVIRKEGF